jgi:hypothetical protein
MPVPLQTKASATTSSSASSTASNALGFLSLYGYAQNTARSLTPYAVGAQQVVVNTLMTFKMILDRYPPLKVRRSPSSYSSTSSHLLSFQRYTEPASIFAVFGIVSCCGPFIPKHS